MSKMRFLLIFLISLLILISLGLSIFILNPPKAIRSSIFASFTPEGEASGKDILIDTLDSGRFRIATADSKAPLYLTFELDEKLEKTDLLMLRRGYNFRSVKRSAEHLRISLLDDSYELKCPAAEISMRTFFPLEKLDSKNRFTLMVENIDADKQAHLVVEEVGLYKKNPNRFPSLNYLNLKIFIKGLTIIFSVLGLFFLARLEKQRAKILGTIFIFAMALATFTSTIFLKFSPEWSRDLKSSFASDTLNSAFANYHIPNYGLYMANSICEGKGPLLHGIPPWYKMPGYGYILSIVCGKASYLIENLLSFAVRSALLQVFLFIFGLTFLFWSSIRIIPTLAAAIAAIGLLFLPTWMIFRLNIEGVMPAIALFCLGTSCLFIEQMRKSGNCHFSWRYHFLFHASFALWFFLRTDVLPGWAVVSIILYCRNLRSLKYLVIPILLFLTISLPWALFKKNYIGVFSMTTESVGASFMGGLWEVPNKFIWTHSDSSFLAWIDSVGLECKIGPTGIKLPTKEISDFAIRECFLFCGTYPLYVFSLVWHKFIEFVNFDGMSLPILFLLMLPLLSILMNYKRLEIFIISWIILFNMPIFFLFFTDSNRFITPIFICLVFTGAFLLSDKNFYTKLLNHKKLACFSLILSIGILLCGKKLDDFIIHQDQWRYWAPFLDPSRSSFNVVKNDRMDIGS